MKKSGLTFYMICNRLSVGLGKGFRFKDHSDWSYNEKSKHIIRGSLKGCAFKTYIENNGVGHCYKNLYTLIV